jgi:type IV pilus assembly protein PilQ
LKLFNAKIPRFEKRPLITTRFKSAVDRVVPVQTAQMGDTALIAIELREEVPYRVEQQNGSR